MPPTPLDSNSSDVLVSYELCAGFVMVRGGAAISKLTTFQRYCIDMDKSCDEICCLNNCQLESDKKGPGIYL